MEPNYSVIIGGTTRSQAGAYLQRLKSGEEIAGVHLREKLPEGDALASLDVLSFLVILIGTKFPCIFAESSIRGDGSDWNQTELHILGASNICVPVTIFDNGIHWSSNARVHEEPFSGYLLYTPGALLQGGRPRPCDWDACVKTDTRTPDEASARRRKYSRIDPEGYYRLYEQRLLPLFRHADCIGREKERNVILTIPGLGCGCFAGRFRDELGAHLERTLERLLQNYGESLERVKVVYFDPYRECDNATSEIHGIKYMVRPLLIEGNGDKPQLCRPEKYQEEGDDFSDFILMSMVAWDHVSWPGNDFYGGGRATDDGVKAAATDSMRGMTGVEGQYSVTRRQYQPPEPYGTWGRLIADRNLKLDVTGRIKVYED